MGGYPIYRPYPCTYGVGSYYNPYYGAYGVAHGVYGPYHGAAAGAAYNPYTGTYARGATAYGPYGSQSVAGHIILTPGPRPQPTKGRTPTVPGDSQLYPTEIDRPIPSITPMRTGRSRQPRVQRAEPRPALRPSTGTPPWRKPPAVICMPRTTATFTRTPVTVGTHTTTATGTRSIVRRTLRRKERAAKTQAPIRPQPSNGPRVLSVPTSRHKVAVPERAMWIGISRTGKVAQLKVSVLIASSGAEEVLTAAADAILAAGDARA